MRIRDGREADADAVRHLASGDVDPVFLRRERTLRVAEVTDDGSPESDDSGSIVGFLAFVQRPDAIHVTRFDGEDRAVEALLDDVVDLATRLSVPVEAVVLDGERGVAALETRGFENVGRGPRFRGLESTRYRIDVDTN